MVAKKRNVKKSSRRFNFYFLTFLLQICDTFYKILLFKLLFKLLLFIYSKILFINIEKFINIQKFYLLIFIQKFKHIKTGIYNSRVAKPRYKTELRIMTSQTNLLTQCFSLIFRVSNSM